MAENGQSGVDDLLSVPVFGGNGMNRTPPGTGISLEFLEFLLNESEREPQDLKAGIYQPQLPPFTHIPTPPSIDSWHGQPFREKTQWLDFGHQTETLTVNNRAGEDFYNRPSLNSMAVGAQQHDLPVGGSRESTLVREDDIGFTDSGYASAPKLKNSSVANAQKRHGENTDLEDSRTMYSAATTIAPAYAKRHVADLVQNIYSQLGDALAPKDRSVLLDSLPELVKAFAIRLAEDGKREIMYFIHKRHQEIATQLADLILHGNGSADEICAKQDPDKMSLGDKITLWNSKAGMAEPEVLPEELFQGMENDSDGGEESDDGEDAKLADNAKLPAYSSIILGSFAYKWFISSLRTECCFHWEENQPRTMVKDIRNPILSRLPRGIISKKNMPRRNWAEFRLPWPGLEACLSQRSTSGYATSLTLSQISEVFTATGTLEQGQIATVREYFHQTWPVSGPEILVLLQRVIHGATIGASGWHSGILQDKTQLIARIDKSWLLVMIIGPAYSVAECGEQLAWLAAALFSPTVNSVIYTTPRLGVAETYNGNHPAQHVLEDRKKVKPQGPRQSKDKISQLTRFDIEIVEAPALDPDRPDEKTWSRLIGSLIAPTFVQGFPTARRPDNLCSGIELPFEVLLALVGAQETSIVNESVLLHGSRVRLELVRKQGNVFCWHKLVDPDERPHCVNHDLTGGLSVPSLLWRTGLADINSDLAAGRHVLGECRNRVSCGPGKSLASVAAETARECLLDSSLSPTGSSLDPDMLSIQSNSGGVLEGPNWTSPGFHFFKRITRRLLLEYQAGVTEGTNSDHNGTGDTDTQRQRSGQESLPTRHVLLRPAQQAPQKRQRDDDDDDDDERDQPGGKRLKAQQPKEVSSRRRFLACPFWKLDPSKHWECFFRRTTTVSYVKQHLARRHTPTFYCHRCFAIFETEPVYDHHVIAASCTREAKLEGISQTQSKQLSKKSKGTLENQWFAMWDILFPTEPRPLSIYIDSDQSKDFCLMREFSQRQGVSILQDEIRASGLLLRPEISDQALHRVLSRGLDYMFEHFCLDRSADSSSLGHESASQHGGSSGHSIVQPLQRDTSGDSSTGSGLALASSSIFSTVSRQSSNSSAPWTLEYQEPSATWTTTEGSSAWPRPVESRVHGTNGNVHGHLEEAPVRETAVSESRQAIDGNWRPIDNHAAGQQPASQPSQPVMLQDQRHSDLEWLARWEENDPSTEPSNLDELLKDITYEPLV
ncbi:hypothetical protein V8F33_013249 [Rhypophila sp. PSN 637]